MAVHNISLHKVQWKKKRIKLSSFDFFSVGESGGLQKSIVILMISVTTLDNPEQYTYNLGKIKIQYYAHLTSMNLS